MGKHQKKKDEKESTHKKHKKSKENKNEIVVKLIHLKKKLVPFKDLKIEIKEKELINKTSLELKNLASQFDLNPVLNFYVLSDLKNNNPDDYTKYIKKYKYTLNFVDAFKLQCFNETDIENNINEYNINLTKLNLKNKQIKSIQSLAKIKLFNLFFYLIIEDISSSNYYSAINKIKSYSNDTILIYKIPNSFGNFELQCYSYIGYFVDFLTTNSKDNDDNNEEFTSSEKEQVYFNWQNKILGKEVEVDISDFEQRKAELKKYIGINEKEEDFKDKEDIIKEKNNSNKNQINREINNFINKVNRFYCYKNRIIEMVEDKDILILEKIRFIYYSILFPCNDLIDILQLYCNCIRTKPYDNTEINKKSKYIINCKNEDEFCELNGYKNFALDNFNYNYKSSIDNPFNFNAVFYTLPAFYKKNILQRDNDIYNEFKNFIKHIYSSKIMKDIFYLSPEFNEFLYPFDNEEIVDEALEYMLFLPFSTEYLKGYTQKEFPLIIIGTKLKEDIPKDIDFSKIICEISQIINTCLHEQLKHYIKGLIFYNSFRFKIKKRINSNLYDYGEENKYINGIRRKIEKKNYVYKIDLDGGEKAEIYLYGKTLDKINFSQAYQLFMLDNWNKNIPEHITSFNKVQDSFESYSVQNLKDIKENENLCPFFKILSEKFCEYVSKSKILLFESNASSGRTSKRKEKGNGHEDSDTILFDYSCFITINKNYIKDSSF